MLADATLTETLFGCPGRDRNWEARLMELAYDELRRMASGLLRREAPGHTLQTSALVHEAYLRLGGGRPIAAPNRRYFFASAARAMRRVLVDHARRKHAERRDGGQRIDLDDAGLAATQNSHDMLALNSALTRLSNLDPRQAQVVELRFFGGLSVEETAEALGVSEKTVKRDWAMARAWLKGELA